VIQHKLIDIDDARDGNGRLIAICYCGWKSLPTSQPIRSVEQHARRVRGLG